MADHDPLDLDGQEAAQQKARTGRQLAAQVEKEDVAWLMSNKQGRRIVFRLLERAGVNRTTFVAQSSSQSAFNEGMRNFGLMLYAEVAPHVDHFAAMQRENAKPAK